MLFTLTDVQLCGWVEDPYYQTLYIVSWRVRDQGSATIKCDNGHILFEHTNLIGELVYSEQVPNNDRDAISREANLLVEHLVAIADGT